MPSATAPPRSILNSSSAPCNSPKPPTLSEEERNRQIALHHARLLQYRKDIEARNLASTETLLDLPTSPSASPPEPCAAEVQTVKEALKTFQPSDHDALVEERNIDNRCGYVLCPRENRNQDTSGKYRVLIGRKEKDFKVVTSKEMGRWCSDECGKMALYLRVQLGEEPAWTREWQADKPVELYSEKEQKKAIGHGHAQPAPSIVLARPNSRGEDMQQRLRDLAVERGDKSNIDRMSTKVAVRVKENEKRGQTAPAPPSTADGAEDAIEGYVPKGKRDSKPVAGQEEDVEDVMPTI
ncbi:MAG: hypothetical protein LQ338_001868 [Usnochroma carphineum]|nr:MAG: hypothetical protein LQ338_001868 [Usnochroma carphineum]